MRWWMAQTAQAHKVGAAQKRSGFCGKQKGGNVLANAAHAAYKGVAANAHELVHR